MANCFNCIFFEKNKNEFGPADGLCTYYRYKVNSLDPYCDPPEEPETEEDIERMIKALDKR